MAIMKPKLELNQCFNQLEQKIAEFSQLLRQQKLLAAKVFELPPVEKGQEHDEITQISVNTLENKVALDKAIKLYNLLFIFDKSESVSSKAAIRLPGALCFSVSADNYQQLTALIDEINKLKHQLKYIVTKASGVDENKRFEFVHDNIHGLITLNAYRTLTYVKSPNSVRFGWANKKIINKITKAQMLDKLQFSYENSRTPAGYQPSEWLEQINQEIRLIASLREPVTLKTQRPVKVQPIARVWNSEQQKQTQYACPLPLLIFLIEPIENNIIIGDLKDYDASNITLRHKPKSKPLELLIPRLNLYRELS